MGISHTSRTASLPHPAGHQPGTQLSARDQYSQPTPSFRRPPEHTPCRSPPFPSQYRRHPISPSPSISAGFPSSSARMESSQYGTSSNQNKIPPLDDVQTLGKFQYQDTNRTPAKVGVNGIIDKGFFQAEGEWTCYRRNYFSCVCSFTLSPYFPGVPVSFMPSGSTGQPSTIHGFAMTISAVVAENDQHAIELVQHTPKRDKGPTKNPPKIPLMAKQEAGSNHNHHIGLFSANSSVGHAGPCSYPDGWVLSDTNVNTPQTEYTFERIQFKQATQNNGKRRAAQQYYHLIVELWANTGPSGSSKEHWVKVAYRKSAKMIVRGRSPGHYQNDRRGSSSNGPSGSGGGMGTNYPHIGGAGEYGASTSMLSNYTGYNAQGTVYGNHRHHHGLPSETLMAPDEEKAIESTKAYQYYPGALYESQGDHMFNHHSGTESMSSHVTPGGIDLTGKVKHEYDATSSALPRLAHTPSLASDRRCGAFEGRSTSNGYYPPSLMSPNSTLSIPMT